MVPVDNRAFFTDSAAAAGTLIGLLFVVISLRSDSIFGAHATPNGRALAGSSFTTLVNAFFISLMAAIPNVSFGIVVLLMALISLYNTIKRHRQLERSHTQVALLAFSLAGYSSQLGGGIWLTVQPDRPSVIDAICYLMATSFAIALLHAWALLQGKHIAQVPES